MQDMIPPNDRSIRNIPLSRIQAKHAREDFPQEDKVVKKPRKRTRKYLLWIVSVVLVCLIIGLASSILFAGATITLHARTETVSAPKEVRAELNPPVGGLQYQTFTVSRSATTTVPASGTQKVSRQASGIVTIYNTYSSAPQRLIANTRFAAPDGKIYKIRDSVVVPGTTKKSDGTIAAGTAIASVYADAAGEDYNRSESTNFTIPGFKGDPRYAKFYAESKGAISGGFVGTQPAVAQSDLASANTTLEQGLASAVSAAAEAAVPEGYIMVTGTTMITYSGIVQTPLGGSSAAVSKNASISGLIVKSSELATIIARLGVQGYNGEAVGFTDASNIKLTASTTKQGEPVIINILTPAELVWQYDQNAIRDALLGKPKDQFENVLKDFGVALDCSTEIPCSATIRPFWASNFPEDSSKIIVVTK